MRYSSCLAILSFLVPGLTTTLGCGSADSGRLFTQSGRELPVPDQLGRGGSPTGKGSGGSAGSIQIDPNGGAPSLPSAGGRSPVMFGSGGAPPQFGAGGAPVGNVDSGPPLDPSSPEAIAKCKFTGTWASFVTVPVEWPATPLVLHAGTGKVNQWTLSHRIQDSPTETHESNTPCLITLPDLAGDIFANNQKFGIRFPNTIFDIGAPVWNFKTKISYGVDTVTFEGGPVATLDGASMPNPATGIWPPDPSNYEDQDHDGNPGITVLPVDPHVDPSYNWPPVGLPAVWGQDYPRAGLIFITSRSVANLHGTVDSCDSLTGYADIVTLGDTPSINSKIVGCIKTTGETCVSAEADFLQTNRPQFVPTGAGTLYSVRMPDNATCEDVRRKFPN